VYVFCSVELHRNVTTVYARMVSRKCAGTGGGGVGVRNHIQSGPLSSFFIPTEPRRRYTVFLNFQGAHELIPPAYVVVRDPSLSIYFSILLSLSVNLPFHPLPELVCLHAFSHSLVGEGTGGEPIWTTGEKAWHSEPEFINL
jgi:hypothetical protein